jgi:predicted metal-dependent phosphoesterase TrpH
MLTELHCHSTASDGVFSPSDLVAYAHAAGVELLALTDHDTIAGHEEAMQAAARVGLRVIPGIEISALSKLGEIHILGYNMRPQTDALREQIAKLRDARAGRAKAILQKLHELGIDIPFEAVQKLAGDAIIGRPYIARALVEGGFVKDTQAAFDLYLADGKPANVPMQVLDPAQAIALIHASGGVAVVAHPGLYHCDHAALIANLAAHGLDGIEVYYPDHAPADVQKFEALARQHGLIRTGGSDFHTPLGEAAIGSIKLPKDALEAFLEEIDK